MAATAGPHSSRRTITLSTIVSTLAIVGVILPVLAALLSPWFVGFISNAVGGEIKQQVHVQVAPVNAAMKVLLEGQVAVLEDEIALMEYRRDRLPNMWNEIDARELINKQRRLTLQRNALSAMEQAQRESKETRR